MNADKHNWKQWVAWPVLCALCFATGVGAQEPPKRTPEQERQVAQAREFLEEARKIVILLPSEQKGDRAVLLQEIAVAYADAGDIDTANQMLAAMGPGYRRLKANVLSRVAIAQARSGDVSAALSTIDSAQSPDGRSSALSAVVIQLAKEGYWGPARQMADRIEDTSMRHVALNSLAQVQAAAGDASAARATAEAIADDTFRERMLRSIDRTDEALAAGKQVKLQEVGFPVVALGDVSTQPGPDPFLMQLPSTGLAVGAKKSEDPVVNQVRERVRAAVAAKEEEPPETGLATLREAAQLAASIATPSDRADQLFLVALVQAELGGVEEAKETAALLSGLKGGGYLRARVHSTALRIIASVQAASGDVAGARGWAEGEPDAVLKASVLVGVAEGILRRLEVERWLIDVPGRINRPKPKTD